MACGIGNATASATTGRLLDWIYQRRARTFQEVDRANLDRCRRSTSGEHPELAKHRPVDSTWEAVQVELDLIPLQAGELHPLFPLEEARLVVLYLAAPLMIISQIATGWCIDSHVRPLGPIILLVLIGISIAQFMAVTGTMLVDYLPGAGAGITACNNLWRCCLGAVTAATVQYLLNRIGVGWTFTLAGGLTALCIPCFLFVRTHGPRWRRQRWLAVRRRQHDAAAVAQKASRSGNSC